MNVLTLLFLSFLYPCGPAKVATQASLYIIWLLVDPTSSSITRLAVAVVLCATFTFIHVILHILANLHLSGLTFITYLVARYPNPSRTMMTLH